MTVKKEKKEKRVKPKSNLFRSTYSFQYRARKSSEATQRAAFVRQKGSHRAIDSSHIYIRGGNVKDFSEQGIKRTDSRTPPAYPRPPRQYS